MNTTDIILIIGAVGTLVGVIGGVIVKIIEAKMNRTLIPVKEQMAVVATKTDVILGHVNSAATRDAGIIAAKDVQIRLQQQIIDEQKQTAALLAQAATTTKTSDGPSQPAAPSV